MLRACPVCVIKLCLSIDAAATGLAKAPFSRCAQHSQHGMLARDTNHSTVGTGVGQTHTGVWWVCMEQDRGYARGLVLYLGYA